MAERLRAVLAASAAAAMVAAALGAPPGPVAAAAAAQASTQGLTGRVVSKDGRPVAGVLVLPQAAGADSGPIPDIAVFTDADGRFTWRLKPGRYNVSFLVDGRVRARETVAIAAERATAITVRLAD
jgi:hypothetical protein